MAKSTCLKCNGSRFELVENSPQGSKYKIMFVQCSSCGSPVGTMDYFSAGILLKEQEDKIKNLDHRLANIEQLMNQLILALRNR